MPKASKLLMVTHAPLVDDLRTTVRAIPVQRAFRPVVPSRTAVAVVRSRKAAASLCGAQPQGSRLPPSLRLRHKAATFR